MRITVTLDDKMLEIARKLTNVDGKSTLVNLALKALIERERAQRLVRMGGIAPDAKAAHRGRPRGEAREEQV